jgi:hypothetical protein
MHAKTTHDVTALFDWQFGSGVLSLVTMLCIQSEHANLYWLQCVEWVHLYDNR